MNAQQFQKEAVGCHASLNLMRLAAVGLFAVTDSERPACLAFIQDRLIDKEVGGLSDGFIMPLTSHGKN